jgi:hypothetical protein
VTLRLTKTHFNLASHGLSGIQHEGRSARGEAPDVCLAQPEGLVRKPRQRREGRRPGPLRSRRQRGEGSLVPFVPSFHRSIRGGTPTVNTISNDPNGKRPGLRPFGSHLMLLFPGLQPGLGKRLGLRPDDSSSARNSAGNAFREVVIKAAIFHVHAHCSSKAAWRISMAASRVLYTVRSEIPSS